MGYHNAGPQALSTRRLTGFLSALPAARAGTAERLGAFVCNRRPPVWIARTRDRNDRSAVGVVQIGQSELLGHVRWSCVVLHRVRPFPFANSWQYDCIV